MTGGSIRLRLWSAAAISILVALALAGVGLTFLFERHVERRLESDLTEDLNQLIAATSFAGNSMQVRSVLAEPRFQTPLSGYYWQVDDITAGTSVRSRSLWDATLELASSQPDTGARGVSEIRGPDDTLLIAVERTIVDPGGRSFRAVVAESHETIAASVDQYVSELVPALALLALVLIVAIFVQVTVGLAPLDGLRVALGGVIARRTRRIEVTAPSEVQPLADEINRLLEAQERALSRARTRATDLAHGLKTPLQVLGSDIRALRLKGETDLADEIEKSTGAIRRHIERELARARLAPGVSDKAECSVVDVVTQVVSVVRKTERGEKLAFTIAVGDDIMASIDESDLTEILGNLIDNAERYAASAIVVAAVNADGGTTISISDDGSGIPDADKEAVSGRGVRLDTRSGGQGLGLAIVSDIVEAYDGSLTIADAAPGLKVTVFLPRLILTGAMLFRQTPGRSRS